MVNRLLKVISPLIISVSLLMEPLFGSLLGWILDVQDPPNVWTWVRVQVIVMCCHCDQLAALLDWRGSAVVWCRHGNDWQ